MSMQSMPNGLARWRDRWVEAALSGDRSGAMAALDAALGEGRDPREVLEAVIGAGQAEIGRRWARNEATVAQEHMATAIAHVGLTRIHASARGPHPGVGRIVVACVAGEQHGFPALLLADRLDLEGLDVRYAGADVPLGCLGALVADLDPDVVALSVTLGTNLPALDEAVAVVRRNAPRASIFAGGAGCPAARARALGVSPGADTVPETVALLSQAARLGAARSQPREGA
ncbi:MAG: cobalamin-dependent protein [Myxococcota bacterium]